MSGCLLLLQLHFIGIGIIDDLTVFDPHDTVGVFFRQLRVMGDHDHQPVIRHLLQQLHDLDTGLAVQGSGWFVRQQNIRVIDQRPSDRHSLHLSAGHLVRLFMQLVSKPHLFQRLRCPLPALRPGNTGNGQRQFHIGKNRLVGDQIIALEHKADGMVTVRVPIPVGIFLGGDPVDYQIAAVITVQTTDHVQQCGFTGTAGSQNGHKLIIPERQTDTVQRRLNQFSCHVFFPYILNPKHMATTPKKWNGASYFCRKNGRFPI